MTVVLEIITSLIIRELRAKIDAATALNTPKGLWSFVPQAPRDVTLSAEKINELERLIRLIGSINDQACKGEHKEESYILELLATLDSCKEHTSSKAQAKNKTPAKTEELLGKLYLFTKEFYAATNTYQLREQPLEPQTNHTLFIKACGYYFARRILQGHLPYLVKGGLDSMYIEFSAKLDNIVNEALCFSWDHINGLKSKSDNYHELKEAVGARCIRHLALENNALRQHYGYSIMAFGDLLSDYINTANSNVTYTPKRFSPCTHDKKLESEVLAKSI